MDLTAPRRAGPLPKHRFVFLTLQNYSLIALSSAVEALRMANRVAEQDVYEWTLASLDGKAMVVAMSREACVHLYNEIIALRPDWHSDDDDKGVIDPAGGVNILWPLFGISNQILAAIALCVCTGILVKSGRERYFWVTGLPLAWLTAVTSTAVWQKVTSDDPRLGFCLDTCHTHAAGEELLTSIVGGMRLADYLPTRVLELVVHTADLAVALGLAPGDLASRAGFGALLNLFVYLVTGVRARWLGCGPAATQRVW